MWTETVTKKFHFDLQQKVPLDFFFGGGLCHMTCRILVPQPGIELLPPAVEAQSPNHWTARELPPHWILYAPLPR